MKYRYIIYGSLIFLIGLMTLGFSLFYYLELGEWVSPTLLDLALKKGPYDFVNWLEHPASWYGLHKLIYGVLEILHASIFFMFIGVYVFCMAEPKNKK